MLSRTILVGAFLSLAAFVRPAAAQHTHCHVQPWGPIELTPTPTATPPYGPFPIVIPPQNTTVAFPAFNIPLVIPAGPSPDCVYEISDITSIKVTLQFGSNSAINIGSFSSGGVPTQSTGPWSMDAQVNTKIFTFPPHDAGGMGDLTFTGANPAITMVWGNVTSAAGANTTSFINGVTIEVRGNHYFVPTPGTAVLALAGLACMARRRRGT